MLFEQLGIHHAKPKDENDEGELWSTETMYERPTTAPTPNPILHTPSLGRPYIARTTRTVRALATNPLMIATLVDQATRRPRFLCRLYVRITPQNQTYDGASSAASIDEVVQTAYSPPAPTPATPLPIFILSTGPDK